MGSSTQKCIWMEAGAIDYQLCPLKQNCDLCDFHKEMIRGRRSLSPTSESPLIKLPLPDIPLVQFQPGLQYLAGHFWYQRVASGRIHLGIDSFLWQLFSSLQKVITPKTKRILIHEQCFSWLVIDGGTIYLKTPIPGQIIRVNPDFQAALIQDPHFYLSPENELWILELEIGERHLHECLSRERYFSQAQTDLNKLIKLARLDESLESPTNTRMSHLTKFDFSNYLQTISDNHILIC